MHTTMHNNMHNLFKTSGVYAQLLASLDRRSSEHHDQLHRLDVCSLDHKLFWRCCLLLDENLRPRLDVPSRAACTTPSHVRLP